MAMYGSGSGTFSGSNSMGEYNPGAAGSGLGGIYDFLTGVFTPAYSPGPTLSPSMGPPGVPGGTSLPGYNTSLQSDWEGINADIGIPDSPGDTGMGGPNLNDLFNNLNNLFYNNIASGQNINAGGPGPAQPAPEPPPINPIFGMARQQARNDMGGWGQQYGTPQMNPMITHNTMGWNPTSFNFGDYFGGGK